MTTYVQQFAVDRSGVLGCIEDFVTLPHGPTYVGYALATGAPWQSQDPRVLDTASSTMLRALIATAQQHVPPHELTLDDVVELRDASIHPDDEL